MLIRVLCATLLLGCSLSLSSCRGPAPPTKVLRISSWAGAGDDSDAARIEREVYAEFERMHPGVEIQLEQIPGSQDYVRKLLLSFLAKSEPDVIRLDASSAAVFIENGTLLDLNPFVQGSKGIDLDEFYPNVLEIGRREEKLFAIPVDFTPIVIYYNKKLFDEAGVEYPQPGWIWDEFLAKSKALTNGEQYGFTFSNWMPGWLPWVWNNGGDVLDSEGKAVGAANSEKTIEAVIWLRDLVNQHKVAPSLSQLAAEGAAPFLNAKAAMETSGHWNLIGLANSPKVKLDDVGVAPLPVSRAGQRPVTVIYESGWGIGKNCRDPELAWEFIRYYTSEEVQRKIQSTGVGVCARKDISQERAIDEREQEFLRIVPSGRMPWGAKIEEYNFVESEGQKAMDGILKSGRDPKQALNEFARAVDRQLEPR